jgi:hypothetical protein
MLINQRKTNLSLEQQLKHLQSSTNKTATTSQSPTIIHSTLESKNLNQSLTIKRFSLDEHQQRYFNSQHHFLSKKQNKIILQKIKFCSFSFIIIFIDRLFKWFIIFDFILG